MLPARAGLVPSEALREVPSQAPLLAWRAATPRVPGLVDTALLPCALTSASLRACVVQMSPFDKDTSHTGAGLTLTTSV